MSGRLRHYVCGSTVHDVGALFRGGTRNVRQFPSGVFLYEPGDGRRILFDTGYAPEPWDTGWRGSVYRRILPPTIAPEEDVARRLSDDDVAAGSITHVVLSHLHPDHIGGVVRFPDARLVITTGQLETLRRARLRDAILPGLLPEGFPGADPLVLAPADFAGHRRSRAWYCGSPIRSATACCASSICPGHARGHLGALDRGPGPARRGCRLGLGPARGRNRACAPCRAGCSTTPPPTRRPRTPLSALPRSGIRVVCSHDPLTDRDLLT